jgi:prepilin-type processing-associated H-X9-DG protein/prepilin-type N-terminal cleavage/methylation domain-containing protein
MARKLIIDYFMSGKGKHGFSLVEVMVVVSTVSVVMAVTVPAMTTARSRARAIVCRSNLRQLMLANIGYSNDHDGYYVPAAEDLWRPIGLLQGGYYRWHGKRTGPDEPFDPKKGPLAGYLVDGKVKNCPERVEFSKSQDGMINFERGCGGYGYNMQYLGSRLWGDGITTFAAMIKAYAKTTNVMEVKRTAETLMFADTAFWQQDQSLLVEYSFVEPPHYVMNGVTDIAFALPSIHFRHYGSANVGWADGHVEAKPMANMEGKNGYDPASAKMNIGWFEPVDNTLFDLE